MGEATFYLLAEFKSEEDAEFAEDFARIVLNELSKFFDEWQKIRQKQTISPIERHKMLLKKFPLVAKYIKLPKPSEGDTSMNYLAGECEITNYMNLYSEGNLVKLSDCVWHLASWDNISEFFYRLGARKVVWNSDENLDFFELLQERIENIPEVKKKIRYLSKEEIKRILIAHKIGRKESNHT